MRRHYGVGIAALNYKCKLLSCKIQFQAVKYSSNLLNVRFQAIKCTVSSCERQFQSIKCTVLSCRKQFQL